MQKIKKNKLMFCILLALSLLFFAVFITAQETGKAYLLTLNYKKVAFAESLSLIKLQTADGSAPDYSVQPERGYTLEIISDENEILKSMKFSIPVGAVMLMGLTNEQAQGSPENLNFTITLPYFSNAKSINIYDKDKTYKILEILISAENANTGYNLSWLYIAMPLLILAFLVYVEIGRRKYHRALLEKRNSERTSFLRNYIILNLRKGFSKEQIRNALLQNNYNNQDIEEAFEGIR